jgi:very-short-patch-repair endonuclease
MFGMGYMTERARKLRRNQTEEEQILWHAFRNRNFVHKVRRQKPIGKHIVDFYCHEARLAIEIDGDMHRGYDDEMRDAQLLAHGIDVIRFSNTQVRDNVFDVIAKIKRELDSRVKEGTAAPSPRTSAGVERAGVRENPRLESAAPMDDQQPEAITCRTGSRRGSRLAVSGRFASCRSTPPRPPHT